MKTGHAGRGNREGCPGVHTRARSPFIVGAARCARGRAARRCPGGCTGAARRRGSLRMVRLGENPATEEQTINVKSA